MLAFMAILFLIASLFRSAGSELLAGPFRVKLGFLVGDAPGSGPILADDGILERRRLGELGLSFRTLLLVAGRRSGWLDDVGRFDPEFAFAAAKMFG
jgi:hypothetical protein